MSSDPVPTPLASVAPGPRAGSSKPRRGWLAQLIRQGGGDAEITVYHHAPLFYWWPVWLLGFVFAVITYLENGHLAIVPQGTEAAEARDVDVSPDGPREKRDVLILPRGRNHLQQKDEDGNSEVFQPTIFMARHRLLGTIYALVLLVVIAVTNVSVRGLWSLLFLLCVVSLTIIFYLAHWWGTIFHGLGQLSVYINLGGYLLISLVLFVLWFVNVAFFDRQTYMTFTPGQVRVRLFIGGAETCYDTAGMVVQKQRNDLFRHWVLGFGSGDLLVRPAGVPEPFSLPNVLRVHRVVEKVERLMKEKVIVRGMVGRS